uniref:Uncharacterized protein n=1 Tax=Tetranychus urticae TaxID=32264 RepID=A0A158P5C2_TETUR
MIQRKTYCPKDSDFNDYFVNQIGSGFGDIRIVRGPRYQRGYGFGSFIARLALPIIKALGKEALDKGVSIGKRVVQDPQIQEAFKEGVKDFASKGLAKIKESVKSQQGSGRVRLYKRKRLTEATKKPTRKVQTRSLKRACSKNRTKNKKHKDIFA